MAWRFTKEHDVHDPVDDAERLVRPRHVPESAEAEGERLDDGYVREHDRDE